MAQQIKLEIDPESYEDVKGKLVALYDIAEKTSTAIEKAVQQSMHLTAYRRWLWVSICVHIITGFVLLYSAFGGR